MEEGGYGGYGRGRRMEEGEAEEGYGRSYGGYGRGYGRRLQGSAEQNGSA